MDLNKDVIAALQYLLPGFLAAWVFYGLTSFPKPSQFERIIQALIFTLIIRAGTIALKVPLLAIGRHWSIGEWSTNAELASSIAIALIIGIAFSYYSNNGKIHSALRRVRLTKVTSYPSEWAGVFSEKEAYIVLQLNDERRLYGWPKIWPSDPKNGHFLIEDPYWINEKGKPLKLNGMDSILLNVEDVKWVEFVADVTEVSHGNEIS